MKRKAAMFKSNWKYTYSTNVRELLISIVQS